MNYSHRSPQAKDRTLFWGTADLEAKLLEFQRYYNLDVHIVLDNYSTHKTALIRNWFAKRPRFHLHFTPTRSVKELEVAIREYLDVLHNESPKLFVWTKTADEILANIARYGQRTMPHSPADLFHQSMGQETRDRGLDSRSPHRLYEHLEKHLGILPGLSPAFAAGYSIQWIWPWMYGARRIALSDSQAGRCRSGDVRRSNFRQFRDSPTDPTAGFRVQGKEQIWSTALSGGW